MLPASPQHRNINFVFDMVFWHGRGGEGHQNYRLELDLGKGPDQELLLPMIQEPKTKIYIAEEKLPHPP